MTGIHIESSRNLTLAKWWVWCGHGGKVYVFGDDEIGELDLPPGLLKSWSGFASDRECALKAARF